MCSPYVSAMRVITLTTDFGIQDWFVAAMKGVILGRSPSAHIVDVTHAIAPGDIRSAAFVLANCASEFPKRTVHVAVVDPGVGSSRKAIAVRTERSFFVGRITASSRWPWRRTRAGSPH
jgi:S-adenosylmethionine hydrolase